MCVNRENTKKEKKDSPFHPLDKPPPILYTTRMNTTNPINNNNDDSFDWHEEEARTPERIAELEECERLYNAEQNGEFVDPYGFHEDPNQMYDE